MKITKWF